MVFDAQPSSSEALSVAQLARQDPDELEALGDRLREEAAHLAAAECRWLLRLAEFDRRGGWGVPGARSCAHWLGWACGLGPEAARERVRVARALSSLPTVTAAFAAGELSFSKVRAITRVATAATEAVLVDMAQSATAAQLEQIVRGYRRSQAAADARTAQAQFERRRLRWSYDDDGMLRLSARLPADEGAHVIAALKSYEAHPAAHRPAAPAGDPARPDTAPHVSAEPPSPDPRPDGDDPGNDDRRDGSDEDGNAAAPSRLPVRADQPVVLDSWDASPPPEARAADALIAMATTAAHAADSTTDPAGHDLRHLIVHIDAGLLATASDHDHDANDDTSSDVAGASGERAELDDGQPLAIETIRRLACDTHLSTLTHAPDGSPLDVGRRHRRIPRRLRRALTERDQGCRFPHCPGTRGVDAHHIQHWADGGATDLSNLVSLCRFHHRLVHEAGFTIHLDPHDTVHIARPNGTPLPSSPPPLRGDPATLVNATHRAGIHLTATSLTPDWDGRPQDISAAIEVLTHHANQDTA